MINLRIQEILPTARALYDSLSFLVITRYYSLLLRSGFRLLTASETRLHLRTKAQHTDRVATEGLYYSLCHTAGQRFVTAALRWHPRGLDSIWSQFSPISCGNPCCSYRPDSEKPHSIQGSDLGFSLCLYDWTLIKLPGWSYMLTNLALQHIEAGFDPPPDPLPWYTEHDRTK